MSANKQHDLALAFLIQQLRIEQTLERQEAITADIMGKVFGFRLLGAQTEDPVWTSPLYARVVPAENLLEDVSMLFDLRNAVMPDGRFYFYEDAAAGGYPWGARLWFSRPKGCEERPVQANGNTMAAAGLAAMLIRLMSDQYTNEQLAKGRPTPWLELTEGDVF